MKLACDFAKPKDFSLSLDRERQDIIDIVLSQYVQKGDRYKLVRMKDGRHLLVNGEDRGFFPSEKQGVVWRPNT